MLWIIEASCVTSCRAASGSRGGDCWDVLDSNLLLAIGEEIDDVFSPFFERICPKCLLWCSGLAEAYCRANGVRRGVDGLENWQN